MTTTDNKLHVNLDDVETFTIGEAIEWQELSGQTLAEMKNAADFDIRGMAALVYLLGRRERPDLSYDDVLNSSLGDYVIDGG